MKKKKKAAAADAVDLISELPQGVHEIILNKLPIRDAVKTSILSRRWRYKWTSLTHLVFDDDCLNPKTEEEWGQHLINFITGFLLLHNGPIHKFSLSTLYLSGYPHVDQWLLNISRKHVKELFLNINDLFCVPSSVFSYTKLIRLELVRCKLKIPPNFGGFLCLKHLSFDNIFIPNNDIQFLISSSPLLEKLTLTECGSLELTINSPNLKYLSLYGIVKNLCLANSPLLVYITINMYVDYNLHGHFEQSSGCIFDKFLGGVPNLEILIGGLSFITYLSIGYQDQDYLNSITYHHLKLIELYQVSFHDMGHLWVVRQLISRSPNLQDLQISISGYSSKLVATGDLDMDSWKHLSTLPKLKTVKMTGVSGEPHEMKFIKYLLKCSPGLETMTIEPEVYRRKQGWNMLIDLVSFHRASPHASIVFLHDYCA